MLYAMLCCAAYASVRLSHDKGCITRAWLLEGLRWIVTIRCLRMLLSGSRRHLLGDHQHSG